MKSTDRIYSAFVISAILFWNPMSFWVLYHKSPIVEERIIWSLYVISLMIGMFLIWLIYQRRLGQKSKDVILSGSILAILVGLIFSLNAVIDRIIVPERKAEEGLVFPPNMSVTSKTVEYEYEVSTNSIGIRDHEVEIDKSGKYRILCFGDSWTMGFGVDVTESWPKQLEKYLIGKGITQVEVLNLGRGGQFTTRYLSFMEKAIPVLKPDLVLVGVLQLDDLAQLYEHSAEPFKSENVSFSQELTRAVRLYGRHSIGDILNIWPQKALDLKSNYVEVVRNKIAGYDQQQKSQYQLLPDTVRRLFETGNLNPGLLNTYVSLTYKPLVFNDPTHPATKMAVEVMDKDIHAMKHLCTIFGTPMIFINMPTSRFTGHDIIGSPMDVYDNYLKDNNQIDSIYRTVASKHNIPYLEMTNHFIDLEPKNVYFFLFDGHPTARGQNEIATFIGRNLIEMDIIK